MRLLKIVFIIIKMRIHNDWKKIDCKDAPLEDEDDMFPDGFDD